MRQMKQTISIHMEAHNNELYFLSSWVRFMEAELDLNDIIQEMHVIATIPELYHLLVELNAVQSLLGLLSHDNTDILSNRLYK